jgi:hypothetical protein
MLFGMEGVTSLFCSFHVENTEEPCDTKVDFSSNLNIRMTQMDENHKWDMKTYRVIDIVSKNLSQLQKDIRVSL